MVEKGASDLHITTGSPPQLRIDGSLVPLKTPPLTPVETKQLCYSILADAQKHKFEEENELDLSFGVKGLSRFRANIFMQRGAVAAAFRTIPFKILTFQELGLPPIISELAKKPRGLVLVTGPTGSGKSTTLASIIDKINTERHEHIITIEDPIEYLHPHKNCVVNQREVGADTHNFKKALKNIRRAAQFHRICSQTAARQSMVGMQTFNQRLASLVQRGTINPEGAIARSSYADQPRKILASGVKPGVNRPVQAR